VKHSLSARRLSYSDTEGKTINAGTRYMTSRAVQVDQFWVWRTFLFAMAFTLGVARLAAAETGEDAATAQGNPLSRISIDSLSATRDRPIFSASRRPPLAPLPVRSVALPPPPPPPEPVAPPNLMFYGTFESDDDLGAVVQPGLNERSSVIRFGTYVQGWRVTEISRQRLVLSLDDRTVVFSLFNQKEASAPPIASQSKTVGEPQLELRLDEAR
jgi:hypothetical protein